MTIEATIRHLQEVLSPTVGASEARAMAYAILEDVMDYSRTRLMALGDRELLPETTQRISRIARRILDGEPMQYATGRAHWRGRVFYVDDAVLIPRPETAQLVDMITTAVSGRPDLRVLDIGTGSGCIAISLALDLAFPDVTAVDISPKALAVARKNAEALKARVNFTEADAFDLHAALGANKFDVIVSNPPYVLESERPTLDPRVADHEPSLALFVSDASPIAIYESIARYAVTALKPGGCLYFEINPLCANALSDMLTALGFTDIDIVKDYLGANRFITARLRS